MNVKEKLRGIIGVINTPFNSDKSIDYHSLGRYVNHSIECGVTGFLTLGMAAEINTLTIEEKELIVKTVINEVQGRVPVICGVASDTQAERILLTEKFLKFGCNGIMVNIVFKDEDSYRQQIREISELKPEFLMIQDWDHDGYGLPIKTIKNLFYEIECFKCLKIEVVPAGVKYTQVLEETGNKLHVSGGWAATQMIEALDRGVDAFMPTVLHDVYNEVFQLYHNGRRLEAIQVFNKLLPILSFSHQHLDISIHFNKKLVHKQELFSTDNVREPILPFDKYHIQIADELLGNAIKLSEQVK